MDKFTIEDIKKFVKDNSDCELLSYKYIDSNTKIQFKCKCGNLFNTTFNAFKYKNKRQCNQCGYKIRTIKLRLNIDNINDFVKNNSKCKLLSTKYINNHTKMKFQCECGNKFLVSFNDFKDDNQRQCKECGIKIRANKRKNELEKVVTFIKDNSNCELLESEYINVDTKMKFKCECGNEFETTFYNFNKLNKRQCNECTLKSVSGENNYNWNPNITQEEREHRRLYNKYILWRQAVFERDNYTCQCCEKRGNGILNAHHLNGYDWDKEHRVDVNNGVTLCENCHKEFHLSYGYGGNTKEQFYNYKNNKRKDEVLL